MLISPPEALPVMAGGRRDRAVSARTIGVEVLLRRLGLLSPLGAAEISLVLSLAQKPKVHAPGTMICPRDDGSPFPRLIVAGWACRPRILLDGRRQMLSVLLPGDLIGDRGDHRPLAMNPAVALTSVSTIGAAALFEAVGAHPRTYPGLTLALAESDRIEEEQLIEHVVRLGCQTAIQRVAHCLLELHRRLAWIGFTHDGSFPMPLTQETLSDLLGLSLVHVNRVISRLKREGLVEVRRGVARIRDFEKLRLLSDQTEPNEG